MTHRRRAASSASSAFTSPSALDAHRAHAGPDTTPMVDVVLVILIFFMAATAVLVPDVLLDSRIADPNATHASTAAQQFETAPPVIDIHITIDAQKRIRISGLGPEATSIDRIAPALRALTQDLEHDAFQFVVIAQPDVPIEALVQTHAAFQEAQLAAATRIVESPTR